MDCKSNFLRLQAYADGEIDAFAVVEIEQHLQKCPTCRTIVDNLQASRDLLRKDLPRFPTTAGLNEKLASTCLPRPSSAHVGSISNLKSQIPNLPGPLRPQPAPTIIFAHFGKYFGLAASFLVVLGVGVLIGVNRAKTIELTDEAVSAHVRSLMANHLMDVASTDQHTVKPWFAGKIDFSPPVVDLATQGFPLIGGRLDHLDGRPAAALVYQRGKHYLNLFIWPVGAKALPDRQATANGYQTIEWSDGGLNYVAVGEIPMADLVAFAKEYRGPSR